MASALGQESVRTEVVVVDDGSSDETRERLARPLAAPVTVVRHERSRGVARARNAGVAAARASWVAFLDDDDHWAPGKLRLQLAAATQAGASFAYASALHVDPAGNVLHMAPAPAPAGLVRRLPGANVIPAAASNVIVRSEALERAGGFDEALAHFADWELWIRVARRERSAASPQPLVAYVQHEGSMRASSSAGLEDELTRVDARHHPSGLPVGAEADRRELMRWIADAQRASGLRLSAARIQARAAVAHRSPSDAGRAVATLLGDRVFSGAQGAWRSSVGAALERRPFDRPSWLDDAVPTAGWT